MATSTDPNNIGDYLISARAFDEYLAMFDLVDAHFRGSILDCPGGGSSFTAGAVRVFPLTDQAGRAQDDLMERLRTELAEAGLVSELRNVPYEFQRGANQMVALHGRPPI